jgi:hypothetical protein
MNLNFSKNTIIALVVGAVLIVAAVYLLFFQSPSTVVVVEGAPTSPEEQNFLILANQLEPLSFETGVLSDPRFMALVDIHTPIVSEPAGRRDPFAPLGK